MQKSLTQQAHNISYVLVAEGKDFTKTGNVFRYLYNGKTFLIESSFKENKYCITIEVYDTTVFTSNDPDTTVSFEHHKSVSADYISYMLRNFKTL